MVDLAEFLRSMEWSGSFAGMSACPRCFQKMDSGHTVNCPFPVAIAKAGVLAALDRRCYVVSESHLGGYRLSLGFETIDDIHAAQEALARHSRAPSAPVERTITISIDVEVKAYQDVSGLTPDELAERVYNDVEKQRNELTGEARIRALQLLAGDVAAFGED